MRVLLASAALLGVVLAGCAKVPTAEPRTDLAEVSSDAGAIDGLVHDESLLPLPGATVLLDGAVEARTNESGRFAFSLVTPGTHALLAFQAGFRDAAFQLVVSAGEIARPNLLLVPETVQEPYFETTIQDGTICASVGFRSSEFQNGTNNRANPCGIFSIAGVAADLDQEWLDHVVGSRLDGKVGFWGETEWQPSQTLGQELVVNWGVQSHGIGGSSGWPVIQIGGRSPLSVAIPLDLVLPYWEGTAEDSNTGACPEEGPCELYSLHFGRPNVTTLPQLDVAPYIQQRYTDYLTTFYYGELPVRFSALPDR